MAILGKWSGGTVAISPGTTWAAPANLFPTEDRNDSSAYTFTASTSTLTLPSSGLADGYLFIGAFEYEDTSNGRHNPQGKFVQASGTGTFVGGPTGGYNRDNSEDRAYIRTWAFVDGPSASSTFQFQWKRDTDSPTGGTVRSELQVIPFYYSDIGLYTSTSASLYGGTTPNQVTGFTGTDGTNITITSDVVSVTGDNKRYLVLGSQFYEGRGGRTQRWHGLDIDGVQEDAAKAYSYYRNTSNDESGDLFTWLLETATATVTIEQNCYRGDGVANLQGGAEADGSTPAVGDHALVVIELNDSAEVFRARDDTQSALLATTGPVDLQINTVTDFNDTASFTDLVDSSVNVVQTSDCLFGANISVASNNVANTTRWTAYSEFTVNGTEDPDSFAGDYMRNDQSTTGTFGWSANLLGFQSLTAGDDVGVSVTELAGSEGGGAGVSPAGWSGFWGINLDTLEATGSDIIEEPGAGSLTLTGQVPTVDWTDHKTLNPDVGSLALTGQVPVVSVAVNEAVQPDTGALALNGLAPIAALSDNITVTPDAGSLTLTGLLSYNYGGPGLRITGFEPSIVIESAGAGVDVGTGSLTLEGKVPTLDQTQHITEEPNKGALALTGQAPTIVVSDHQVIGVPAGSLTITGEAPEILVSITVFPDVGSIDITGEIPLLVQTFHHIRAPPKGTLTLAGIAPTVDLTDHQTVEPGIGSLTLTGEAPTANTGANVIELPDSGSLTLTGLEPSIALSDNKSIAPDSGSIALTGLIPTIALSDHQTVSPDSGSLSITGYIPTLDYSWTVNPGVGSLTLTGEAPALVAGDNRIAQPAKGSLSLLGYAPLSTLTDHRDVNPDTGALTLTGEVPTVLLSDHLDVSPLEGSLSLTGLAPSLDYSWTVHPGAGALTITGEQPAAISGDSRIAQPPKGVLALTGLAPSINVTDQAIVLPDNGVLTLTGLAPTVTVTGEVEEETFSGGYFYHFEQEMLRRESERRKRERERKKAEKIKDELERKLALAYRDREENEARLLELERITDLTEIFQEEMRQKLTDQGIKAAQRALEKRTFSAMEALERNIKLAYEEEEFLIQSLIIVLNG